MRIEILLKGILLILTQGNVEQMEGRNRTLYSGIISEMSL